MTSIHDYVETQSEIQKKIHIKPSLEIGASLCLYTSVPVPLHYRAVGALMALNVPLRKNVKLLSILKGL